MYSWRGNHRIAEGFKVLSDPGWHAILLLVGNASVECHSINPAMAAEHDEKLAAFILESRSRVTSFSFKKLLR